MDAMQPPDDCAIHPPGAGTGGHYAGGEEMITTTLNRIRDQGPCADGWQKLLKHLGKTQADDEPLPFSVILENNGLDDALWCCRAEPQHAKEWRLYAVWCTRQVQHMIADPRSLSALDVAERHANGKATADELAAARAAALAALAAWAAAWAAQAAAWVAGGAAGDAARDSAWAAWAAARVAGGAAGDAARVAQSTEFLRVVAETGAR